MCELGQYLAWTSKLRYREKHDERGRWGQAGQAGAGGGRGRHIGYIFLSFQS